MSNDKGTYEEKVVPETLFLIVDWIVGETIGEESNKKSIVLSSIPVQQATLNIAEDLIILDRSPSVKNERKKKFSFSSSRNESRRSILDWLLLGNSCQQRSFPVDQCFSFFRRCTRFTSASVRCEACSRTGHRTEQTAVLYLYWKRNCTVRKNNIDETAASDLLVANLDEVHDILKMIVEWASLGHLYLTVLAIELYRTNAVW